MKKLFDNPYFVGLLVAVALFVVFRNPIISLIDKLRHAPIALATTNNVIAMASQSQIPTQKSEPVILPDAKIDADNIQWILKPSRNPFQRINPPDDGDSSTNITVIETSPDQPMVLTAVLFEKDKKYAVINNVVVSEGETIAGYKVESIEHDYVILSGFGTKRRLNFGDSGTHQPAQSQPQSPKKR